MKKEKKKENKLIVETQKDILVNKKK